ncbi:hypothetical protein Vretifemale_3577, partial [Volvox reticuliferus]
GSQCERFPITYTRYLASKYALHLNQNYAEADSALSQLLKLDSCNDKSFNQFPVETIVAACEVVRSLKDIYSRKECRDFRVQHGLTKHATVWEQRILPSYAWVLQSLWTDCNREAGVQSDIRMLLSGLKSDMEDLLINFLPSKPYYHYLDDLDMDSWGRLLLSIVRTQIPFCLARELEAFRRYLIETASFPQPAVHIDPITRCLLLCGRVAHLGLRHVESCESISKSRMLEHACALRLTLAERPWNWDASDTDTCLFGLLKRASQGLPWRWLKGVPICTQTTVLLKTPASAERVPVDLPMPECTACEQRWRMLSHATVQCYLGWWLAASMLVLRPGGEGGLSLPINLQVACRACWQRRGQREEGDLRGLQAPLYAAGVSWVYGLLTRQCRSAVAAAVSSAAAVPMAEAAPGAGAALPPPCAADEGIRGSASATAASGVSGAGSILSTAPVVISSVTTLKGPSPRRPSPLRPVTASAAVTAAMAATTVGVATGNGIGATVAVAKAAELPYSAQNMYDMILPVGEHCVDYVMAVSTLGSAFAETLAIAALSLSLSLQHMDSNAAAVRLPRCWQLLGRILAMDLGSTRSRTLRDLAQAAGRALRLKVPSGPSATRPAVPMELTKMMMADRKSYSNDSGSHRPVRSAGCASGGGSDEDRDTDSCCSEGVTSFSPEQQQQPQQPEQPQQQGNHPHLHHHLNIQPQGRWTPIDGTCESPSLTLRCLLNSPFLSSLERTLRALLSASGQGDGCIAGLAQAAPASQLGAAYDMASACVAVDLALRRPGCWPALLAHAPAQQMSSLILTMRKLTVTADKMALRLQIQQTAKAAAAVTVAAAAAAATEAQPLGDPRVLW